MRETVDAACAVEFQGKGNRRPGPSARRSRRAERIQTDSVTLRERQKNECEPARGNATKNGKVTEIVQGTPRSLELDQVSGVALHYTQHKTARRDVGNSQESAVLSAFVRISHS